ncbi:hypothetical protein ACOSP7_001190 [Xanthoceras sorbifolium]
MTNRAGCAICAFLLLLTGTFRYGHFRPYGKLVTPPLSRVSQVIVVSLRKINLQVALNGEGLYEVYERANETIRSRRIL